MSLEKLVIDDLIVLGNAAPDEISDKRKTVCTAGYSPTYGMIRIYPVPPNAQMHRWNVVEVPLERNPKDTRLESWKIQGSKSEWDNLTIKIKVKRKLERKEWVALLDDLHSKYGVGCIEELNEKKLSLGLIKPQKFEPRFERRSNYDSSTQMSLFADEPFLTIHNYDIQPRISYRCSSCKAKNPHDQQLLEWGAYEWIRKNPEKKEQVWENLHVGEAGYNTSFLVGNMALHRTSFMIISIFRYRMGKQ